MLSSSLSQTISKYKLFKDFTLEEIQEILADSTIRKLEIGEILITPGSPNDTLYILVAGEITIVLEKGGTKISIPIYPGQCMGEMSLVLERPTSALAVAEQACKVLCIPGKTFWDHIMMTRKGGRNMMSVMAARLQRTNYSLIQKVESQLKYEYLEKDLETAEKIQSSIVPNGDNLLPNRPAVDAYALLHQARKVGGDFFDATILDDDHIYIAIGDVSGKGMPAALFMMHTFTSLRLLASNDPSFESVMPQVNNMLARKNEDMMFVTIFAGVLNVQTGILRYVNAGHNPPFISQGGNDYQLMGLPSNSLVGIMEQTQFPLSELQLAPGDSLLLYTDGVSEAMNFQNIMFETDRIEKVVNRSKHPSMKDLVRSLENAIEAFVQDAQQHDDITIFAFRYLGFPD